MGKFFSDAENLWNGLGIGIVILAIAFASRACDGAFDLNPPMEKPECKVVCE